MNYVQVYSDSDKILNTPCRPPVHVAEGMISLHMISFHALNMFEGWKCTACKQTRKHLVART